MPRGGVTTLILRGDSSDLVNALREGGNEIRKTSSETQRLQKDLESQSTVLGKLGPALGLYGSQIALAGAAIVAAAAGVAAFVRSQGEIARELENSARILGISIQQYEAFVSLSARVGGEADHIREAFRTLSERVSEAAQGSGDATEAFDRLGVAIRNQDGTLRTLRGVLPEVSQALREMASAERIELGNILFGDEDGRILLSIMERYGTELENIADGTDTLGAVGGSVTGILARASEGFAAAGTEAGRLALELASIASPGVIRALEDVVSVLGVIRTGVQFFVPVNRLAEAAERADRLRAQYEGIIGTQERQQFIADQLATLEEERLDVTRRLAVITASLADGAPGRSAAQRRAFRAEAEELQVVRTAVLDVARALTDLQNDVEGGVTFSPTLDAAAFDEAIATLAERSALTIDLNIATPEEIAAQAAEARRQFQAVLDTAPLSFRLNPDLEGLNAATSALAEQSAEQAGVAAQAGIAAGETDRQLAATAQLASAQRRLNAGQRERERQAERISQQLERQRELSEQVGQTLGFGIQNALLNAENLSDVLSGIGRSLAGLLIQFGLQSLPGVGGFFGGARQSGGPVSRGRAYVVGEDGPELFVPPTDGTILANGGSGVTVNFAPTIQTTDGQIRDVLAAEMPTWAELIGRTTQSAIARNRGRPSSVSGR